MRNTNTTVAAATAPAALVIDDNPRARRVHERNLAALGFAVHGVSTAEEALDWVETNGAPRVAVVDVTLPRMSGFTLCAALKDRSDAMPVIVTGARPGMELEDHARALEVGVELVEKAKDVAAAVTALTGIPPHKPAASSLWSRLVAIGA